MMRKIKTMSNYIYKNDFLLRMISLLYGIILSYVLFSCLFFQHIQYFAKTQFLCSNIILLLIGLFLTFCVYKIINKRYVFFENHYLIWLFSFVAFCIQIYSVYNYYFFTDWDSGRITAAAFLIGNNGSIGYDYYFSVYPNNLLLVSIYALIVKICNLMHIGSHAYYMILCFQSALYILSGILLFYTIYNIKKNYMLAYSGWLLYLMLVIASPWVSIPYSDSVGLIFPIFVMWILTLKSSKRYMTGIRTFVVITCACIGYHIKPQIIIILIATVVVYSIQLFNEKNLNKKLVISSISAAIIGVLCVSIVYSGLENKYFQDLDKEMEFGVSHFLMMGLNDKTMGSFYEKDVEFSASFDSKEERKENNIKIAKARLHKMGIINTYKLLNRKLLTNYNDGTFAWGKEGRFYCEFLPSPNKYVAPVLRNIYYKGGKFYSLFCTFVQMVWLIVLFLSFFSIFSKKTYLISIAMLSIIGLTMFELIFEARARYLFIYVPIYIILAMIGVDELISYFKKFKCFTFNKFIGIGKKL